MADDAGELFATIPMEVPLPKLVELVQSAAVENAPLAEALEELRVSGHPQLPPMIAAGGATPSTLSGPVPHECGRHHAVRLRRECPPND